MIATVGDPDRPLRGSSRTPRDRSSKRSTWTEASGSIPSCRCTCIADHCRGAGSEIGGCERSRAPGRKQPGGPRRDTQISRQGRLSRTERFEPGRSNRAVPRFHSGLIDYRCRDAGHQRARAGRARVSPSSEFESAVRVGIHRNGRHRSWRLPAGAHFLEKPFTLGTLATRIRAIIDDGADCGRHPQGSPNA